VSLTRPVAAQKTSYLLDCENRAFGYVDPSVNPGSVRYIFMREISLVHLYRCWGAGEVTGNLGV